MGFRFVSFHFTVIVRRPIANFDMSPLKGSKGWLAVRPDRNVPAARLIGRLTALRRVRLGQAVSLFFNRAMDRLLKDWLLVNNFKLGLEVGNMVGGSAAVGATASISQGEVLILNVVCNGPPI